MKKVILLVLLMPDLAFGQVIENFESGNLNNWIQSAESRWKLILAKVSAVYIHCIIFLIVLQAIPIA